MIPAAPVRPSDGFGRLGSERLLCEASACVCGLAASENFEMAMGKVGVQMVF